MYDVYGYVQLEKLDRSKQDQASYYQSSSLLDRLDRRGISIRHADYQSHFRLCSTGIGNRSSWPHVILARTPPQKGLDRQAKGPGTVCQAFLPRPEDPRSQQVLSLLSFSGVRGAPANKDLSAAIRSAA